VTETVDPAAAPLGSRTQRITTRRHRTEFTACAAQRSLAEGQL
jgi:hypothetical protein